MNGVVIVAAGKGSRMKMDINKQFIKLNEKEIVAYTIEKFYNHRNIQDIVVVVREEESNILKKEILEKYNFKNIKIAFGGKERQDSVYNGLKMLDKDCKNVLVHDGARPFVSKEIIDNSIDAAKKYNAVVVGVPVKDTIKIVNKDNDIVDTPNRSVLWAVQTPQTFNYEILMKAYENAFESEFYGTDDAMLVERIGYKVKMIEGSYNNIKVTTPEDINMGIQILKSQNL
ncbi:2-C-methyl-D-erythritol 4-phosphate cytidylyltransferase [Clostridium sp. CCUG 7971]|uniref:2-C-methyl-D-erythritol 4-phosphate cytidylyltransferase n=1 Tax=Clostridium sp. CCUG 7971 TaxID=2811414 RepID=UPI001ABB8CDA|nr:2-C-methyl-D-erythritol 4-phosphate cytidylyltransferase [Clostridium sp. CCUG 7971]MBO3445448.1 2-C-methyl-D-erythritol 4-phosphate cytidylyltransferase [Clostridium sp. CCUG 7971]